MNRPHLPDLCSIFTLAALIHPLAATAQVPAPAPQPRQVTVTGEATVFVVPDQATIRFGAEIFDPNLATATGKIEQQSRALIAAVKALGIDEQDLQTSAVSVEIIYNQPNFLERRAIVGYQARRMYTLKLRDLTLVEKVVNSSLSNGANLFEGVEFESTQLPKFRDEARRLAARAAREKAEILATELSAKLGPVQSISEQSAPWFPANRANFQNQMAFAPAQGGADPGESLPAGRIAIRASVFAVFALE